MRRSGWRRAPLVVACIAAAVWAGSLWAAGAVQGGALGVLAVVLPAPAPDASPQELVDPVDTTANAAQGTATGVGGGASPAAAQEGAAGDALARARMEVDTPWYGRLVSVLGMAVLLGLGWLLSVDRARVPVARHRVGCWGCSSSSAW